MNEGTVPTATLVWWIRVVRVMAVLSLILLTVAIIEGRALRSARAELQNLRTSCQPSSSVPVAPK